MFEPLGLEGIKNAYCGACERELPDGFEGADDRGVPHYWRKATEEWVVKSVTKIVTAAATAVKATNAASAPAAKK